MANTVVISRGHLIYGVCLPVAVLLGYLLAQPYDSGSIAVVFLCGCILSIPILLRWHHAILIFSVNAVIMPWVPGRPNLWMLMALISFLILVLNRAIGRKVFFFRDRQVALSLIFLALVVLITAYLNGGIHLSRYSGNNAGGKRYLYIFSAVFLYFGLATVRIKPKFAQLAAAVFFLSSLTGLIGYLAAFGGPAFYFLVELFPVDAAVDEMNSFVDDSMGIVRFGGIGPLAIGLACYLFARYGLRGLFDLTKPWRLLLLLLTLGGCLFSGFRTGLITFALLFGLLFYLEGLFRTRYFLVLCLLVTLFFSAAMTYTQKMPLVVQRTLAFIPFLNVDPMVRGSADNSTDWRLEMWRELLPTVPNYLLKGKGYAMDVDDFMALKLSENMGYVKSYETSIAAGDYHSGPLSVIIPFGIFGVIGFVWFLGAALRTLRWNQLYGDPGLKLINNFLLVLFVTRILLYIFIFGSLYSDLFLFTSVIGLSISLNGGMRRPGEVAAEEGFGYREQTLEYDY